MTEFFTQLSDLIQNNLGQVILILTTPVVGSVTIGMLIGFFTNLIKNRTAKKYTKPAIEKYNELKAEISALPGQFKEMLDEFNKNNLGKVRTTYVELQAEVEKAKQELYKDIANADDGITPKVEEIQTKVIEFKNADSENSNKNGSNLNENKESEEITEEEQENENQGNSVENTTEEEGLLWKY